ncbi:uncharacterized protein LOC135413530 [Pseudopipra pipra]|uniref:uncharacterized protein LOC135413530 n=1 Tax=Pseudopipra pipra TaxID=415032 RepID=UPI0031389CB9
MWKMKKFTNLQPRKWLSSWQRKHKVDNWQTQAAAQEEENSTSSAAVAEQVRAAGAESQGAAPQSPRGCGRAVLDTLQRVARATRRRLAVGIRRRGQEPEPQREVEPGMEVATAGTSPAAGSERQDSFLQSPYCPPSPFPSHPEALSGQWAGAAAGAALPVAESKEGAWSEELSDICSLLELPQEECSGGQSWRSREKRLPVPMPREAWSEPWDLQAPTRTARAPVCPCLTSPYIRPQAPSPDACPLSPSPSQLSVLTGQWAGLPEVSRESRREENAHQPLSQEEDSHNKELAEKKGEVVKIYTIWVKPSLIPVLLEPQPAGQEGPKCPCIICAGAAEEVVRDLHSTSPAPAGPRHHQPTAAAPQRPRGCCPAVLDTLQRVARATLSGIAAVIRRRGQQPGEQQHPAQGLDAAMLATAPAAGAESQAAALHSPCCPPSPSPSQLEARSGQWAGAAAQTVLPLPLTEEGAWSEDESLWDISSLLERCQGQENTAQSWSTGGASSSVSFPSEAWAEPWDSSSGTSTSTSTD